MFNRVESVLNRLLNLYFSFNLLVGCFLWICWFGSFFGYYLSDLCLHCHIDCGYIFVTRMIKMEVMWIADPLLCAVIVQLMGICWAISLVRQLEFLLKKNNKMPIDKHLSIQVC